MIITVRPGALIHLTIRLLFLFPFPVVVQRLSSLSHHLQLRRDNPLQIGNWLSYLEPKKSVPAARLFFQSGRNADNQVINHACSYKSIKTPFMSSCQTKSDDWRSGLASHRTHFQNNSLLTLPIATPHRHPSAIRGLTDSPYSPLLLTNHQASPTRWLLRWNGYLDINSFSVLMLCFIMLILRCCVPDCCAWSSITTITVSSCSAVLSGCYISSCWPIIARSHSHPISNWIYVFARWIHRSTHTRVSLSPEFLKRNISPKINWKKLKAHSLFSIAYKSNYGQSKATNGCPPTLLL